MTSESQQEKINELLLTDYDRRQKEAAIKSYDQRVEATIKMLTASYDKAAAYTNLMIVAGYAGGFAVWNSVKSILSHRSIAAVGLLLSFSLLSFVLWEVTGMVNNTKNLSAFNESLHGPFAQFEKSLQDAQAQADRRSLSHQRFWPVALWATLLPAFMAGLILFYNFVYQLIQCP
jgi:hypothetical protein